MLRPRIIPVLQLRDGGVVKTTKFSHERYIGDPINSVRIFNQKEVDELIILDISATRNTRKPEFNEVKEIVSEAFMPVGYGGGITSITDMEKLFQIGVEKIIMNTAALENDGLLTQASDIFGSQSIVVSLDVKKDIFGSYRVYTRSGRKKHSLKLEELILRVQEQGAGEIILNSIERDGTMQGYDLELIKKTSVSSIIPIVSLGGAGNIDHLKSAISAGSSAVAAGSMFIYQGTHKAVLISYVSYDQLLSIKK